MHAIGKSTIAQVPNRIHDFVFVCPSTRSLSAFPCDKFAAVFSHLFIILSLPLGRKKAEWCHITNFHDIAISSFYVQFETHSSIV